MHRCQHGPPDYGQVIHVSTCTYVMIPMLKVEYGTLLCAIYPCKLPWVKHNITQFLSYVMWDHVSHEHISPLIPGSPVYGEHLGYISIVSFSTNNCKLSKFF